jgi:hypothetical protein
MILQSEQLDQLFTALAKAQGEFGLAEQDGWNPFFKSNYATLTELVRVSRPALTKYGVHVKFKSYEKDGIPFVRTTIGHSSGQFESSEVRIEPMKKDVQSLGSYKSYVMRYEYKALTGVMVRGDEADDDGESTMARTSPKTNQVKSLKTEPTHSAQEQKSSVSIEFLDPEQLSAIGTELVGFKDIYNVIISEFDKLQNIPKSKFKSVMEYIKNEKGKLI